MAAATWVLRHLSGFRMLRQWEDGDEVCSIYEFELKTPMGPKALVMADWSTVRHGQLASALVVFDAAAAQQALAPPPRAAAEWR